MGKVTGAVFIGEGIFQISPPTEIERYQLKKFTDSEILNAPFSELYLRFTDSTFEELKNKLQFVAGEVEGKAKDINKDCGKRAYDVTHMNLQARILENLLFDGIAKENSFAAGFFYADINVIGDNRLFFIFDPKSFEEVKLRQDASRPGRERYDLICSFKKQVDGKITSTENTEFGGWEILPRHYNLDIQLEVNGFMQATCELTFVPLVNGIRAITFELFDTLEVAQVKLLDDSRTDSLAFIREKNQNQLTVIFPYPLSSGQEKKLWFQYGGEILNRTYYGLFFIKQFTGDWFPSYGYLPRLTFDLTFKTPRDYKFITLGKKTDETKEGRYLITRWKQDFPTIIASFNLGYFKIYEEKREGLPIVSVYWNDDFHRKFAELYQQYTGEVLDVGKDMDKRVAADIVNSLNFFQNLFGKCPFDQLSAIEIPASHGQAFYGLLQLGWGTFQEEEKVLAHESFRAHEVSHHWWGDMVGWRSYHDQWLSEGFAEYSGIWFAQSSLKDNKKFFEELKSWRKDILGQGSKFTKGSKAGPLWLGYRLDNSKSFDYSTLVYEKGAFVLHMLRNMLMDFKTFSDDKFIALLKDFVSSYYGKNASTTDFQKIVEKHFGEKMDWFFKQWVYGIEIPKYFYSYATEKVGDKYQVTVKVKQENVSPDFKMQVPVVVVYKTEGYSIFRIWVDKPEVEVKLPPVPMEVKEIVFNPFESVLAEVEEKR